MREMTAMREIHRKDFIARLNRREINRHIRLRAAVRLDVDMFATEKPLRAIDRKLLDDIDIFTTAVPAFPRITFRVFVGKAGTLRFHDRAAGEVLRGDQLDVIALPLFLSGNRIENFRVARAQTDGSGWSGGPLWFLGKWRIAHGVSNAGSARSARRYQLSLFYECQHAR